MKYARIAWAAIQRHRIEEPIRIMWEDYMAKRPGKGKKLRARGFSAIVDTLASKGFIDQQDAKYINREYARYSNTLHGVTP